MDKVSTDSKGTGQVVISTPILLLKQKMIETFFIHLKSNGEGIKTKNVPYQYHWQCNMLFTWIYLAVWTKHIINISINLSVIHEHQYKERIDYGVMNSCLVKPALYLVQVDTLS